jgi:hypothetical protein
MKQRLRVKVTRIQRQRTSVPALTRLAPCEVCRREVETLTTLQAAEILEVEDQVLNAFIYAGQVHAIETVSGSLRICKDSLFVNS